MHRRSVFPLSIAVALSCALVHAAPAPQGPNPSAPTASIPTPMPLDGTWIVLDENMLEGDFFSGTWTWDSADPVTLTVTDLFVVSDQFEVYDNGFLVLTTPSVSDWPAIGKNDPFDPPSYATDSKVALGSGNFSGGTVKLGPGHHEITIRDIHIPPIAVGGPPFVDGTVAFSAEIQEDVVPTVSQWGVVVFALLLAISAKVYFGRRRVADVA